MRGRTRVLAGVMVALAAAVGVDRFAGAGGSAASDGVPLSARARYLDEARLVAQMRGLIGREASYAEALERTRARWEAARDRLVTAPSPGLAEAQFRDEVLQFVRLRGIEGARTSGTESLAIDGDDRLRLIELRLEFETPSAGQAYELLDDIEHLRGLWTRISGVEVSGPGRIPRERRLSASITIEAIAFVEGG